jgi:hypothetical protein
VKVVVLVPRRADNGWRDQLWTFCRKRWEEEFPDWRIVEGEHRADEGLFNRSAAVNRAAAAAGDWDVAMIVDSDTLSDATAVRLGVEMAAWSDAMVVCHDRRVMLTKHGTHRIMRGYRRSWSVKGFVERVWMESCSSAVAVSRSLFERAGGFDERFVGWGREDSAFLIACETVSAKPMLRVSSKAWHLWHPVSDSTKHGHPDREPNERRFNEYQAAAGDVTKIDALTGGPWRFPE